MFLIINAIIIVFPILVYTFFIVYQENMKLEKRNIILKISLFISMYLSLYFKKYILIDYQVSCLILTIILSYLYKEERISLIFSFILFIHFSYCLNYNIYSTIILFISLYIVYLRYSNSNKDSKYIINYSIILLFLYLIFNYKVSSILDIFLSIIVYSFIIYTINYGINESKDIINLHMNLKEFEKEKNIKTNLFKITHEIKNPLTVINGYLNMFDMNDIDKSKRYIEILKNEVNRSLNLLSDFMEFTKIKVIKKECNFNYLVSDIKEVLIPFFIKKNINYSFSVQNNIIVNIDYNRIKQVIINIIKNAVEACPGDNGTVSTTVFTEKNHLIIFVKDNGIGMDKEELDNILVPFYTTKDNGTGLGVSLSKEIIEAHNGKISYDSIKHKYTSCKITIPL